MSSKVNETTILEFLISPGFLRATFAGTQRLNKIPAQRVTLRPVDLCEGRRIQISRNDGRKDISTNHTPEELPTALADILAAGFSNIHITTTAEEIDLRLTKKGELLVGRKKIQPVETPVPSTVHNRTKNLPLPEGLTGGTADALLLAMGIVDRNGAVRPTMRAKFTQINEFLKLLEHALPEALRNKGTEAQREELTILDCGCGASHLTLATAHYLGDIKRIAVRVKGIDVNPEVIEKARARAAEWGRKDIEFHVGKIGSLANLHADIVLALHACDTATDDALAQGIRSGAQLILAVPCCHKYLNDQLKIPALAPIHHQGILHERLADIITDTFRALILKTHGYRAEVIEFISPEHTARNLMIRATKVRPAGDAAAKKEYEAFKSFTGVTPYLETLL